VEGLRPLIRDMERAGVAVDDLKGAWQPIGAEAATRSRALAPKDTGRLAASVRASRRKNGVVITVGGARAPYVGYPYFGIRQARRPFIHQAIETMDLDADVMAALDTVLRGLRL
jgi:hypothetical protein